MTIELDAQPDPPFKDVSDHVYPDGDRKRNGYHPNSLANRTPKPGEYYAVPVSYAVMQWDGEIWIRHPERSETYERLKHLIKPQFQALL